MNTKKALLYSMTNYSTIQGGNEAEEKFPAVAFSRLSFWRKYRNVQL